VRPEAVYLDLRAAIIDQDPAPGEMVTESAVALRFGIARPTAKLAIERLVSEGLLEREAHHAARVPELGGAAIRDIYDARVVVEAAAAAEAARRGAVPAEAVAAHRELIAAAGSGRFAQADIAFHRALVAGVHGSRLARMHAVLMGEVELCIGQVQSRNLMEAADVADQHQRILDAIVGSDPDAAERLTRAHLTTARDALIAAQEA
jgi:DNA-binding GntR family transcriptional regulator